MNLAKFTLGRLVQTPGAFAALINAGCAPQVLLSRHVQGDWGELCDEDKASNEEALRDGTRLLSAYTLPDGQKIWVITEADRSSTTLLLPEEY